MAQHALFQHPNWIFDMDGTLTISKHDFDAIRKELGLPFGQPILEALDELPAEEAALLHIRLNEIELEIAKQSEPAAGAAELLSHLTEQGAKLGILTRNNAINIEVTLKAAGLDGFFTPENLLSRECAAPKPAPDGILKLLNQWQAKPDNAVMVGDYFHDLASGRAAGTHTLYVDESGRFEFKSLADVCIQSLPELFN